MSICFLNLITSTGVMLAENWGSPLLSSHEIPPQTAHKGTSSTSHFFTLASARLGAVKTHVKLMPILVSLGLHHQTKHQPWNLETWGKLHRGTEPWPDLQQLQWKVPTTILDPNSSSQFDDPRAESRRTPR